MRGDWDRLSIIELLAGMAIVQPACRGAGHHGTVRRDHRARSL